MANDTSFTTTATGSPAPSDEYSLTVGRGGPLVLHDSYLVDKMQSFNRERVPERVVHAKGDGAHGFLEITEDLTPWTRAHVFGQVGRRTPMLARFSSVAGEQGYPDTTRDPRGFSMKFYTQEGNWDLVANNTPVFFMRDPSKFMDFIHSQKRMPDSGLRSNDMQWDYWTLSPECAHQVTILMSDRGIPLSHRHMNGYSSHTYSWMNAGGERFYVKYHFKTVQGVAPMSQADADVMAGADPDHHRRDLRDAIARGEHPEWEVQVQVMPVAEAADYRFNPFDITKTWSHADYPVMTIGRIVLDRNPRNYFAEVEQAAFNPSNLVPGTGLSPDKMLLGRVFSYHDSHLYRIGTNYQQLPINAPVVAVHSYDKDGAMELRDSGAQPVYAPNSYGGPVADSERAKELTWDVEEGEIGRYAYEKHAQDDDFGQAGTLVRDVMDDAQRQVLVSNVVGHASNDVSEAVQQRVVAYWKQIDGDVGAKVAAGLTGANGRAPSAESVSRGVEAISARMNRA